MENYVQSLISGSNSTRLYSKSLTNSFIQMRSPKGSAFFIFRLVYSLGYLDNSSMSQRWGKTIFLALLPLLLFVGCSGYESATPELDLSGGNATNGQSVYNNAGSPGNKCSDCHAADGTGVWPYPDIRSFTAQEIATAVRVGPSSMPAYSASEISNSELTDLIAYILTL